LSVFGAFFSRAASSAPLWITPLHPLIIGDIRRGNPKQRRTIY
jgi:hypothetical protein